MSVTLQRRAVPTLALAAVLCSATLAACSVPAPTADRPSAAAPATQRAEGPRLAATNPHPREQLAAGGTLTLPLDTFPDVWNLSHAAGAEADLGLVTSATDPVLYDYTPDGHVRARPEFLTALPTQTQRDGRQVVTYDLNPAATWNDGTPIDHRPFEAMWRVSRQGYRPGGFETVAPPGYASIESITAGRDPHQVAVTFRPGHEVHPVTDLFTSLLHPAAAASPAVFNDGFRGAAFHPEWRAGPYTLERLDTSGRTLTLTRNPAWWGRRPVLDRLVFRQLEDSATITAFAAHELDATQVTTRARYAQVQSVDDLDIRRSQRLTTGVLVFNSRHPVLSDITVRKALWQAIDREQWKKVRYEGMNWVEDPIGSAMYFGFQPQARNNMPMGFDLAGARATLQSAGYTLGSDGVFTKGGTRLVVDYTSFGDDPLTTALDQTLKKQLAAAGVELRIENVTYQAFLSALDDRDFGMASLGLVATTPSPVGSACQAMCSDNPFNLSGVGTAELDGRIKALGGIADAAAQAEQVNAVEKSWLALYGQLPLAHGPDIWAYRRGVANLGPAAFAGVKPHWEDVGWLRTAAGS